MIDTEKVRSLIRTCLVDIIITLGDDSEEVSKLVERIGNRVDWADLEEDVVNKIDTDPPPVLR